MSGTFNLDESRWPIAVLTVEGSLDDAQVDAYVAAGTALLERGEPYVTIIDIRRMGTVSAYSRARQKQWATHYREKLKAWCLGSAFVITSPVLRFVTMTVLLVAPLPMPYSVCKDLDEAMGWAEKRAKETPQRRAS